MSSTGSLTAGPAASRKLSSVLLPGHEEAKDSASLQRLARCYHSEAEAAFGTMHLSRKCCAARSFPADCRGSASRSRVIGRREKIREGR